MVHLAAGLPALPGRPGPNPADQPIIVVGDDTVDGHPGRLLYGKARQGDPVRSSHDYTAWRYGHKWVVLAMLARFPWATRPWALPVLVDLYRAEEDDRLRRRPHRTPAWTMSTILRVMLLWFPDRRFVFVGHAGYGTHELARFRHRHRGRLTLVSKQHPNAKLFEPPRTVPGHWPAASQEAAPARPRGRLVIKYGTSTVAPPPTVRSSRPTCAAPGRSR